MSMLGPPPICPGAGCVPSELLGAVVCLAKMGAAGSVPVVPNPGPALGVASRAAAAKTPSPGAAAYAASKAGVVGFTRECAREYAAYNICVNALLPEPGQPPTQIAQAVLVLCSSSGASHAALPVRSIS